METGQIQGRSLASRFARAEQFVSGAICLSLKTWRAWDEGFEAQRRKVFKAGLGGSTEGLQNLPLSRLVRDLEFVVITIC